MSTIPPLNAIASFELRFFEILRSISRKADRSYCVVAAHPLVLSLQDQEFYGRGFVVSSSIPHKFFGTLKRSLFVILASAAMTVFVPSLRAQAGVVLSQSPCDTLIRPQASLAVDGKVEQIFEFARQIRSRPIAEAKKMHIELFEKPIQAIVGRLQSRAKEPSMDSAKADVANRMAREGLDHLRQRQVTYFWAQTYYLRFVSFETSPWAIPEAGEDLLPKLAMSAGRWKGKTKFARNLLFIYSSLFRQLARFPQVLLVPEVESRDKAVSGRLWEAGEFLALQGLRTYPLYGLLEDDFIDSLFLPISGGYAHDLGHIPFQDEPYQTKFRRRINLAVFLGMVQSYTHIWLEFADLVKVSVANADSEYDQKAQLAYFFCLDHEVGAQASLVKTILGVEFGNDFVTLPTQNLARRLGRIDDLCSLLASTVSVNDPAAVQAFVNRGEELTLRVVRQLQIKYQSQGFLRRWLQKTIF